MDITSCLEEAKELFIAPVGHNPTVLYCPKCGNPDDTHIGGICDVWTGGDYRKNDIVYPGRGPASRNA